MRLLALRAETMQAMRRLKLPCDDITPIGLWGSDMYLIGVNNDQFEVLRLWNVQTEDVTPATLRDLHTESAAIPTSPSAGNAASGARSSARGAASASSSSTTAPASESSSPAMPAADSFRASSSASAGRGSEKASSPASAPADDPDSDAPLVMGGTGINLQPAFEAVAQASAPEAPSVGAGSSSGSSAPGGRGRNGASGTPSPTGSASGGASGSGAMDSGAGLEPAMGSGSRTEEGRPTKAPRDSDAKAAAKDGGKDANAGKLRMTVDGEHLYAEIKGGKIVLKDRTYDSLAHARDSIRRERDKVAVWEYFDEGVKAWRVLNRD